MLGKFLSDFFKSHKVSSETSGSCVLKEWEADLPQLFIGVKFATGASGMIYQGKYKERAVAVKIVKTSKEFQSEVGFLSRFNHPNVLQMIAACEKPCEDVYMIITEYMSLQNLRLYLNNEKPCSLSTETILRLALDISCGMAYLHSQGVIHTDLKTSNLLLNDDMRVKVADFGTSCLESKNLKGTKGTHRYMAPEMLKGKTYTRKVDVYSFGIVLWELTTASVPFEGLTPEQASFAASEKNERPPLPDSCPPALAHLIKSCWAVNPSKRPDFSYIVSTLEKYDKSLRNGLPLI